MAETDLVGSGPKEKKENYDLATIVMIYLGKDGSGTGILRLLETLFISSSDVEEKLKILESEYDIKVTKELDKEVSQMCNISKGVKKRMQLRC